jgi:hypothetical protein
VSIHPAEEGRVEGIATELKTKVGLPEVAEQLGASPASDSFDGPETSASHGSRRSAISTRVRAASSTERSARSLPYDETPQANLDGDLKNVRRKVTVPGRWCYVKTLLSMFLDSMRLARERLPFM